MPPGDIFAVSAHHQDNLKETVVLVKTGQAYVYGWHIKNDNAAQQYVQFFNAAAANDVTLGSTKPVLSLGIEGNDQVYLMSLLPIDAFPLGICIAATTDNENNTAGDLNGDIFYAPK